ncbi:MAG: hypothetical protein LBT49_03300 [Prevotellaceae bacterium]|nr:hypothetical protein [Prevotellaceae bacterium]
MKKLFLLLQCCPVWLAAQNGITISEFKAAPGTVTFTVSWNKPSVDSAWVFVDYNKSGTMTRLELSGATLTPPSSAGSAYMVPGNNRGAWVVASNAGAFSATVQLVAACTDARPCVPTGACAYAINYQPQGQYTATDKITFTGTPPFYLEFNGDSPDTVFEKTSGSYTYNPGSKKLKSFTDATGAPGILICAVPAAQTLTVSAAGYCADATGVQFALSGMQSGATYQLVRNNTVAATLTTNTGGAATFSGTHLSGTYSAKTVAGAYCEVQMNGTHTVALYDKPSVSTMPLSAICYNATASLTASVTAGTTTSMTYTWNIGGTSSTTSVNNKTSQNLTTTTTYTVSVRNSNGCTGAVLSPATITVNALPVATVAASTICTGQTAGLTALVTVGNVTPITYTWNVGGSTSTTNAASQTSQALYANTTYTVQLKNANGCTGAMSAPATITVNALPVINTSPGSQGFCAYVATPVLTVTASAAAGSSLASYQWKTGSGEGTNVGSSSNSYTPTVVATGDYWVVVTDNKSCSVPSAKATITVAGYSAGRIAGSNTCGGGSAAAGIISGIAK